MKDEQIIKQLGGLKGIQPDADYAAGSKLKLIHQTPQKSGRVLLLSDSISSSLSIGLVIVLFVFAALSGISSIVRSPLSPTFEGVNGSLTAEAGDINETIDIHLEEVKYLAEVATRTVAIANLDERNSADEEVDLLLNEAINF